MTMCVGVLECVVRAHVKLYGAYVRTHTISFISHITVCSVYSCIDTYTAILHTAESAQLYN